MGEDYDETEEMIHELVVGERKAGERIAELEAENAKLNQMLDYIEGQFRSLLKDAMEMIRRYREGRP